MQIAILFSVLFIGCGTALNFIEKGTASSTSSSSSSTSAGSGSSSSSSTSFRSLRWVTSSGDIYVADSGNNKVRKVDASSGNISTISGTGVSGYSGDNGVATSAKLTEPNSLTFDQQGNYYFSQTNGVVRKVNTTGTITTVAGTGVAGYSGDGGLATSAQLDRPRAVVADSSNNLFIADFGNHRVRKVNAVTGIITTIAGTGVSGFSGDGGLATAAQINFPHGLDIDSSGNIYIADSANYRIRKIDTAGKISTVAGKGTSGSSGDGGTATLAELNFPADVVVDSSGNLYIADETNNAIRKVNSQGVISTVGGILGSNGFSGDGGAATSAQLKAPTAVSLDSSGNIYLGDYSAHCIRKINAQGVISTVVGQCTSSGSSGDGGAATSAKIFQPFLQGT